MKVQQTEGLKNFIRYLVTATANAALYSIDHPQVGRLCAVAHEVLQKAFGSDSEISFLLIEDELVIEGVPLVSDMYISRFGQAMKAFGIGHVRFLQGITQRELHDLVGAMANKTHCRGKLSATENIKFGKVGLSLPDEGKGGGVPENAANNLTLADIHSEVLSLFKELSEGIKNNQRLNLSGVVELVNGFVDICGKMSHPFQALASLRVQDEYTFIHSANVCILNLAQAMSLGIDGLLLQDIGVAALLHDIGKLYVPEEILNKPGRLDEHEMELIRQHPVKGSIYLLDAPGIPRLAVITAFEHHMKFDRTGYPLVSSDWRQNLCSQMTTISDFFDALRSNRAYRGAMEFDDIAIKMMELAGKDFNPALTENFLHLTNTLRTIH
jgi:HD-GYP domain-containing protein (c-di-GMP phosphodiesterase class II)